MAYAIGIDPGKSGAVAYAFGDLEVRDWNLPEEPLELAKILQDLPRFCCPTYVEHVQPSPQAAKGERRQGAAGMFKFGYGVGALHATLKMAGRADFVLVTPQTWLKWYGLRREKDETETAWKGRHWVKAQEVAGRKVTKRNADAVLIAYYAWRLQK